MKLKDFLLDRGYWDGHNKLCSCPFHNDRNPSAIVNENSIRCFACGRFFYISDFEKKFFLKLESEVYKKSFQDKSLKDKRKYIFKY